MSHAATPHVADASISPAPPPLPRGADRPRTVDTFDWLYYGVQIALFVTACSLVLGHAYLPLVDWPEHLAQDSIVAHLTDPSYGFGAYYRTTGWFIPYQGFRWLHIALASVFGMRLGGRVALLVYVAGTPLAFASLTRTFGRDRWVAPAAYVILVDGNLLWGFAPYAMGTTMLLGGLVMLVAASERGGAARYGMLATLGVALFFTHAQQTALWIASAGVVTCEALRRGIIARGRALALLATLVPAAALLGVYLIASGWIDGRALRDSFAIAPPTVWASPLRKLLFVPLSAGLTLTGRIPWYAYLSAVIALGAPALRLRRVARTTPPTTARWAFAAPLLFLTWAIFAMALPMEYRGQTIAPRIVPLALLALLWAIPTYGAHAPTEQYVLRASRIVVVLAACVSLAWNHVRFAQFDRSMRPLDAALMVLPMRARVASMVYGVRPDGFKLPAYLHIGGYVVTARGGMVSTGFTRTGVSYRETVARDALMVNELWMPSDLGWQLDLGRYGAHYDYVLVRAGRRYRGTPFTDETRSPWRGVRVFRGGAIELWRIVPAPAVPVPAYRGASAPNHSGASCSSSPCSRARSGSCAIARFT